MARTDVVPESGRATDNSTAAEDACPACTHPWGAHDAISRRYCEATIAGALTRGCACPAGA